MEIINNNYSELFGACRSGDIEVVEEILKNLESLPIPVTIKEFLSRFVNLNQ